ncbi:nucleotidyltransferase family protein [Saccharicrinis sp. FJH2]|uniref:nucleotidyltransferase family protein n=1 Tax=Saccharicrinis sp. FJH65 TaxID=3344659 RepID=UPI0035F418FE
MRLKPEILTYIRETSQSLFPGSDIYLFGSRVNDEAKGGDIDLLILSEQKIEKKHLRQFRVEFYKRFGWQKIDLVNFLKTEDSTFKNIILPKAIPL